MFKKVETTVESTSGEQETPQLTANSGDVKTKPEKPKRKFVASLKSNIRQLGSSVVGLKMSKQQKPGSFTDPTQSSELKKKKNKKQKEELGPSLSTDSEQSVGAKPKASKVAANLVKKLSVDKIYQPFIGPQYTGPNVKTSVSSSSTGPTPPLSPESDVKSTSSSEISYESPMHAPKDRLEEFRPEVTTKEQTTAGSTTAEVGKDETTKPVILEDLILQTQQFAESLASPDKPGKNLLAEFIEAESKNNSKKSEDKITNKDVKSQIETKLSEKNDNKSKDQDHKNKTVNLSRDQSKDSKSEKLKEENKKKSDKHKQEKIIESDKERKAKEDQEKVGSKGDKTDPIAQVEKTPQKKDESKVSVKTNPSSKPEVDLNIEKNSTKSDTEKHQTTLSGDKLESSDEKLKQQKFAEYEKQSVIKETEENMDANKQNKITLDGNKSEKRKSVQDGDEKETKHIKIEQDKHTEKGKTQKEKYEKEGTINEKTGTEKDEKENTQLQKNQEKDDKKNTQNEKNQNKKTGTVKDDKENTQIEKNQEKDDKGNIQNEKDKIENTKTETNIMNKEEGKPVDESVSTTSLDIKTPQSSANAVIDNTSKNLPSEPVESDKVTTPKLDNTIINPLDNPSTFTSGKSENTSGASQDITFPLPDKSLEPESSSPKETSTIMSQVPEKRECLYKILVIGELGTGKTSIIKRYVHQFFSQHYRATIGVDFALKVLNWDPNTIIRLQLWDIAGQERFGNMTRVYYKEAVGAFIVFDVTRSATFDAVLKWKQDLDAKVQLADGASIPCVLLANKCDQQKEGIVNNPARMEEYCKEHNFSGWFETSAKENINIDEAAKSLVTQILQNDKVSQNGRDIRDGSKFPLDGKGEQQESKSCSC